LVCKEYVAAKGSEPGALVLSEFAGSAAEMGEAVLVNPWSRESLVEGIETAVGMGKEEKTAMMSSLWDRLSRHDNHAWSAGFMQALGQARELNRGAAYAPVAEPDTDELIKKVRQARLVFLFMDYDGTLVPVVDKPEAAVPSRRVVDLLADMAIIPNFRVCVVSGRDNRFLEAHLPRDITLAAEHGACIRRGGDDEVHYLVESGAYETLRENVIGIMKDFEQRIPGSRVEEKEFGVVWHYRMADPIFGYQQALVLADTLGGLLERTPLGVLTSKKAVEVRHFGVNKGDAVRTLLEEGGFDPARDMMITMGDDRTDEDMFRVNPSENISISVSDAPMVASYVMEQPELVDMLESVASSARGWQYRLWEH
jgi:trehalose 6-phosphate synthase/phosphatase